MVLDKAALTAYIEENYGVAAEHPWADSPEFAVFRHAGNRKWFALAMVLPRERLGLQGNAPIEILNVKSEPVLIASLLAEPGFFPAYHMNKNYWLSIALDGSVAGEQLKALLDLSYQLTAPGNKRGRAQEDKQQKGKAARQHRDKRAENLQFNDNSETI